MGFTNTGLVRMIHKDDAEGTNILEVHPTCVKEHKTKGWYVMPEQAGYMADSSAQAEEKALAAVRDEEKLGVGKAKDRR